MRRRTVLCVVCAAGGQRHGLELQYQHGTRLEHCTFSGTRQDLVIASTARDTTIVDPTFVHGRFTDNGSGTVVK